jgi:hypothetical protein
MVLIKIMKRKDASSVLVAIILATIIGGMLMWMANDISFRISDMTGSGGDEYSAFGPNGNWRMVYLQPFISAVVQILMLEILARIYIFVHNSMQKKK